MVCRKCKKDISEDSVFCKYCGVKQEIVRSRRMRPNGAGTAYKRGKTWTVEVVLGYDAETLRPTRRTKGGFKTKTEALAYAPTLKKQQEIKSYSIDHYWSLWSKNSLPKLSGSKATAYDIAYKKLQPIKYRLIRDLSLFDLQSTINEKAQTFYPARDMRVLLSHLYKLAIADGQATVNLAQYVELPKLEEADPTPFNEKELAILWADYVSGHIFTGYILLMIYSGMMPGELMICEKNMIHWEKQQIVGCGLKTKKRRATPLVIADFIIPVLRDLTDAVQGKKLVAISRDKFYEEFDATLRRCGCRDLTPYACRHTTATALALDSNVAPSVIQEVMRHAKFTTTQRYIHPDSADALAAVNTLRRNKDD